MHNYSPSRVRDLKKWKFFSCGIHNENTEVEETIVCVCVGLQHNIMSHTYLFNIAYDVPPTKCIVSYTSWNQRVCVPVLNACMYIHVLYVVYSMCVLTPVRSHSTRKCWVFTCYLVRVQPGRSTWVMHYSCRYYRLSNLPLPNSV